MMPPDGSELMVRFVQGDEIAFEELLNMYEQRILNFFYRLTGERHTAEDMVQDLFLKVYAYRSSYKPRSSFKYFLFRMARNMWIDHYRKKKSRPRVHSLDSGTGNDSEERRTGSGDNIEADAPSPMDAVSAKERIKELAKAVGRLSNKQRDVIALSFEGGLKYAEIAGILGVPVGTIKSRMHSAVMQLKEYMGEALSR